MIDIRTPEELRRDLCRHLRQQRIAANLTQAMLASKAGIARVTVSQLENGGSVATLDTICRILGALRLTAFVDGLAVKDTDTILPTERMMLAKAATKQKRERVRPKLKDHA